MHCSASNDVSVLAPTVLPAPRDLAYAVYEGHEERAAQVRDLAVADDDAGAQDDGLVEGERLDRLLDAVLHLRVRQVAPQYRVRAGRRDEHEGLDAGGVGGLCELDVYYTGSRRQRVSMCSILCSVAMTQCVHACVQFWRSTDQTGCLTIMVDFPLVCDAAGSLSGGP